MSVDIGQIVVHGGIFWIQLQGFLQLLLLRLFIVHVSQETRIRNAHPRMLRMRFNKILVAFTDWVEAIANSTIQIFRPHPGPFGGEFIIFLNPLIDLRLRSIVILH